MTSQVATANVAKAAAAVAPAARWLTYVTLSVFGATVVVPNVILLWIFVVLGGAIGTVVALDRTGGLGTSYFAVALWGAAGATLFAVGLAVRSWLRRRQFRRPEVPPSAIGWWSRHQVVPFTLALAAGTSLCTWAAWGTAGPLTPTTLAAFFILTSLLFVIVFGALVIVGVGLALVRVVGRWAMRGPFRAGLVAGTAALLSLQSCAAWVVDQKPVDLERVAEVLPEVLDEARRPGSKAEFVRVVLAALADEVLGPLPDPPRVSARLPGYRAVSAEVPPPRVRYRVPSGFHGCMERLRKSAEFERRRDELARRYGIGRFGAEDVLAEALLRTCLRVDRVHIERLGGYFWRTAENEAKRQLTRWSECTLSGDDPAGDSGPHCDPRMDDDSRDERRLAAIEEQLCRLDPDRRRIIELHLGHDRNFGDIGADVGMAASQARNAYYDAIKLIRARLAKSGCDLD